MIKSQLHVQDLLYGSIKWFPASAFNEMGLIFWLIGLSITQSPKTLCFLSTAFLLPVRGGWPWEKAQSCATGAEDGSKQGRHRETCRCSGSEGFTEVLPIKTVMFQWTFTSGPMCHTYVGSRIEGCCVSLPYRISEVFMRGPNMVCCMYILLSNTLENTAMCLYYDLCRHNLPFNTVKDSSQLCLVLKVL